MSYLQTVQEIRAAAVAVNGGRFDHGRIVDFSQAFDRKWPMIWLYPFTINDPSRDEVLDTSTIIVAFYQQDRPDTSNAEREVIIGHMDALCTAFMEELGENVKASITQVSREPQYQQHMGTVSGMAVRFTYQNLTPC